MRALFVLAGALALAGLALPAGAGPEGAFGLPEVSYSARMVVRAQGQPEMPMTVHYTPERQRVEMSNAGQRMVVIQQTEPPKAWMLIPAMKMYAESPPMRTPIAWQRDVGGAGAEMEVTEVGRETVNGFETTKYRVRGKDLSGRPYDGHVWATDDRIMIRMEGEAAGPGGPGKVTMEVTELDRAAPDPALFRVPPPGYNKMPAGAMGPGAMTGN